MAVHKEDSIFSTEALCHTQYFLLPSFDFIQLLLGRRKEHVQYQTRQGFMSPLVITAKAMWLAINFKNMVSARLACGTCYMMVQIYMPTGQISQRYNSIIVQNILRNLHVYKQYYTYYISVCISKKMVYHKINIRFEIVTDLP